MSELGINIAKLRRRAFLAAAIHFAVALTASVAFAVVLTLAIGRFRLAPSLSTGATAALATFVFAVALWRVGSVIRTSIATRPRIVPYYRSKVIQADAPSEPYHRGLGIVADLVVLDDAARQLGVSPLSTFGFGDDLLKQRPNWSPVDEGLATITVLLQWIAQHPAAVHPETERDLRTLAATLNRARETQQCFSLIVRYGSDRFISGVELEKREGSFWP